jgi:1-acyl-sn-glycerol-3-phosphate acyltransferase
MVLKMSLYNNVKKLSSLIKFLFRLRCEGIENMPAQGPVILCCNHNANIDPVLLGAVLNRKLNFMAKYELFKIPLFRTFMKALGAFPVHRGTGDKDAIKMSYKLLAEGSVLGMFPEGTRNRKGGPPMRFKSGAALFAFKTGAAIVPAAIICKGRMRFYKPMLIRIGKPLDAAALGLTDGSPENLRDVSERVRLAVASLIEGKV